MKLPAKVVGGYWTYWGGPLRLRDIPSQYNTVFLFHATPVGGAPGTTGAVEWNMPSDARGARTNFKSDLAELRKRAAVIMSVGGAHAGIRLDTRTRSQAFVNSIKNIYTTIGGFDGVDFNNYEADSLPTNTEMVWICKQLKSIFGVDFAITTPPAPFRSTDKSLITALSKAGVLDMASPQYYDWYDELSSATHIGHIAGTSPHAYGGWTTVTGSAAKTGVGTKHTGGTGIGMTVADIVTALKKVLTAHPNMRGAFVWNITEDEKQNWAWAKAVAPIVNPNGTTPTPVAPIEPSPVTPIPTNPRSVSAGNSSRNLNGVDIYRSTDYFVLYTPKQTTVPTNRWGVDVVVREGKVTAVHDRAKTGASAPLIPRDGYVLSGHGTSRNWLLTYGKLGATVTLS